MEKKKENLTKIAEFAGVSFKTMYNYKNANNNKNNIYKALKLAYFLKDFEIEKIKEDLEELEAILKVCCRGKESLKETAENDIKNIADFVQHVNELLEEFKQ